MISSHFNKLHRRAYKQISFFYNLKQELVFCILCNTCLVKGNCQVRLTNGIRFSPSFSSMEVNEHLLKNEGALGEKLVNCLKSSMYLHTPLQHARFLDHFAVTIVVFSPKITDAFFSNNGHLGSFQCYLQLVFGCGYCFWASRQILSCWSILGSV